MGTLIKFLLTCIVLVCGLLGWSYVSTGHLPLEQARTLIARVAPMLDAQKLPINQETSAQLLSNAKQLVNKVTDSSLTGNDGHVKMYKWKDAKGVVHFDNHPVAGAQEIVVDTTANTLPSVSSPSAEKTEPKAKTLNDEVNEIRAAKQAHDEQMNGI